MAGIRCTPISGGFRLATVPLVSTVSAIDGIVRAVLSTIGTIAPLVRTCSYSRREYRARALPCSLSHAARREYSLRCTSCTARFLLPVVSYPVQRHGIPQRHSIPQ